MKEVNFFDIKTALSLLQSQFGICKRIARKRRYQSENGEKFAISQSKEYDDSNFWSSIDIDELQNDKIDYFILVVGYYGLIKLPTKHLVSYKPMTNQVKGRRDNIYIQKRSNKFFLHPSEGHNDIDITEHFIEYEQNFDYLYICDREKILSDAINFKDYEEQYVEGNISRIRHESKLQKERIAILENHTCQICGFHQSYINKDSKERWIIEVDHIIEKSQGGGETINNLLVLCPNCHAKKTNGIITIDKDLKVYENGFEVPIKDHHLKLK